jgi:pimeloyl-ACP methyl ester carboxylesterase
VEAPDGVSIACEVSGEGPPLVLVHGAGSARWSFDAVRPHLERSFTVWAMDRRGRGDSTDTDGYTLEREYDDVAEVVRAAGPGTALMGHSYGGLVAAGAALELALLPRLALYEPAMGGVLAEPGTIDHWEALIDAGERERVVREFLRDIAGMDETAIERMVGSAVWEGRLRAAPTVPRELRAEHAHELDREALSGLAARVLLLVGSESPDWATRSVAAYEEAIPDAERVVLPDQGHSANMTAPELLAAELERFLA